MKNLAKRRKVMERSIRLGHCICDPKTTCPCERLRVHDVCPCAGERLQYAGGDVRLTRLVERPGCASKIDQAALHGILRQLPATSDPRVLVGVAAGDDAGVFRYDGNRAWVQTVDVFAPCVDDPYTFGQIAAANSVSDIYAMGGEPLTALSIIGFPIREQPDAVLRDILRGGIEKMAEAGVAVIGGHSINEREIKAGFAVTGLVDCDRIYTNAGARPGDALVLTKPIGTGILAFAAQIERAPAGSLEAAAQSMAALNRLAAERMHAFDAHACTDVTGFGLMGHLTAMAAASHVDVEIVWDTIPVLSGVLDCLAAGIIPGAVERNRESSADRVDAAPDVTPTMLDLCFDAQTSGGLLVALPAERADAFVETLREDGVAHAAIVGTVRDGGRGRVCVRTDGSRPLAEAEPRRPGRPTDDARPPAREEPTMTASKDEVACCADALTGEPGGVSVAQKHFHEFLRAASAPGALDVHTKQAIAIALSVLAKCEPCLRMHIKKAREKGLTPEEIDEAAWMAIGFGGSPLMMFYNEIRKSVSGGE